MQLLPAVVAGHRVVRRGPAFSIPAMLVPNVEAAEFDAPAVAASIEAWPTAVAAGPLTLAFDVKLRSQVSSVPLLAVQGARLPMP